MHQFIPLIYLQNLPTDGKENAGHQKEEDAWTDCVILFDKMDYYITEEVTVFICYLEATEQGGWGPIICRSKVRKGQACCRNARNCSTNVCEIEYKGTLIFRSNLLTFHRGHI